MSAYRSSEHLFSILPIEVQILKSLSKLHFKIYKFWGWCDPYLYRVFIKYCVFSKILKYIPDSGLSRFPPRCQCVYKMTGQTPALQQNWQSSKENFLKHLLVNFAYNSLYLFVIVFFLCAPLKFSFVLFYGEYYKRGGGSPSLFPPALSIHLWWLPMWYEASQLSVSIG